MLNASVSKRKLPASASAALVTGWIGGAIAWGVASGWTDLSPRVGSYARLDQFTALLLGVCVGALVLALRARHRREPILPALIAGVLIGGCAALVGCTLGLLIPENETPRAFTIARIVTWAFMAGSVAVGLAQYSRVHSAKTSLQSLLIGLGGGAVAAALYSMPGPAELWWPVACTVCGAVIGFGAVGPALWCAPAVVHVMPQRAERHSFWSLHERAVDDGWSMEIGDANVGCVNAHVSVYPSPAGAVLNGYPLYRAVELTDDADLRVSRARCRISLKPSA